MAEFEPKLTYKKKQLVHRWTQMNANKNRKKHFNFVISTSGRDLIHRRRKISPAGRDDTH